MDLARSFLTLTRTGTRTRTHIQSLFLIHKHSSLSLSLSLSLFLSPPKISWSSCVSIVSLSLFSSLFLSTLSLSPRMPTQLSLSHQLRHSLTGSPTPLLLLMSSLVSAIKIVPQVPSENAILHIFDSKISFPKKMKKYPIRIRLFSS